MASEWTFADVWEAVAQSVPFHIAQVHGARRISWREFDARATGIAQALLQAADGESAIGVWLQCRSLFGFLPV